MRFLKEKTTVKTMPVLKFQSGCVKLSHNKRDCRVRAAEGRIVMEWNGEKVERDPEEETMRSSPRRFWELIKAEGAGLLLVNVVFVLTCIPLVTIPAAVFALNWEVREALDDKPVKVRGYLCLLYTSPSPRDS